MPAKVRGSYRCGPHMKFAEYVDLSRQTALPACENRRAQRCRASRATASRGSDFDERRRVESRDRFDRSTHKTEKFVAMTTVPVEAWCLLPLMHYEKC